MDLGQKNRGTLFLQGSKGFRVLAEGSSVVQCSPIMHKAFNPQHCTKERGGASGIILMWGLWESEGLKVEVGVWRNTPLCFHHEALA
jgi:hypothetical protein